MELLGQVNTDLLPCVGAFLIYWRSGWEVSVASSRTTFCERSWISVLILTVRSVYLGLMGWMEVWCSSFRWPKFILRPAMVYLSSSVQVCRRWSFSQVKTHTWLLSQRMLYTSCVLSPRLSMTERMKLRYFCGRDIHRTDFVRIQRSDIAVEYRSHIKQESEWIWLPSVCATLGAGLRTWRICLSV
jgi:hypothetical protein